MKNTILTIITIAMMLCSQREAVAFWGSNTTQNQSGLDVTTGYDVNTVATIRGTVLTSPSRVEGQHTEMTMTTEQGIVTVLLGPWFYWEKQTYIITTGQEITVTGSKAQGKDGSVYLFAQKLDNNTKSGSITLRSETGKPLWGGVGAGNPKGQRLGNGSGAGSAYRGGSMRGGGRR